MLFRYRCNGCSQYYEKLEPVKKHLQMFHYNLLDNAVFCDHCSEFFLSKQRLDKHMLQHATEVFKCEVNDKKINLYSDMYKFLFVRNVGDGLPQWSSWRNTQRRTSIRTYQK